MRPRLVAPLIRVDDSGDGHFGAPRGGRTHRGVDYLCRPGDPVFAPVGGTVTKLGFAYPDDLTWRYIEITDAQRNRHRFFYVFPLISVHTLVPVHLQIGTAQDISVRYSPRMRPHIHYEIIDGNGEFLDVEQF